MADVARYRKIINGGATIATVVLLKKLGLDFGELVKTFSPLGVNLTDLIADGADWIITSAIPMAALYYVKMRDRFTDDETPGERRRHNWATIAIVSACVVVSVWAIVATVL